ncbi:MULTISPECIES: YfaP family protein [Acinetobacter]|uniref:YfaP family protein n=1 Tax=Acinetobacter TaxID=469 RepID=UPI003601DD65
MNYLNVLRKLPLVIALSIGLAACNEEDTAKNDVEQPLPTPSANVSLQVFDNTTGAQISTAQISVVGNSSVTANTNAEGKAQLQKLGIGRSVIKISKAGYADQFITVDLTDKQELTGVVIQLIPFQLGGSVSAVTGGTINLTTSTAQVVIPPNSLRRTDGQAIQGDVKVNIALINTAQDIRNMPGDLATQVNNSRAPLESFGAMVIDLRDSTGAKVELIANQLANIRIPLMARGIAPTTIPLYYFDPIRGYWLQDGSRTLTLQEDVNGNRFYAGASSTLNTVNADIPYQTTNVAGCLADSTGKRVANAQILLEGKDYSGYSVARTNSTGEFSVQAKQNSTVLINGQSSTLRSNTVERTVLAANTTLNECLVLSESNQNVTVRLSWGEEPEDIDSHMIAPDGSHISFEDQGALLQHPFVNLDVDDTQSYGPEIVTLSKLMVGEYHYFVHNYSETSNPGIFGSPIKIELNYPLGTQIFTPITGSSESLYWSAFKIRVADNCAITVIPTKQWLNTEPTVTPVAIKYCSK